VDRSRELGRVRSLFGLVIGAVALGGGFGLRFSPNLIPAYALLALSLAALASTYLARPRGDVVVDLGLLPLAGAAAVAMAIVALLEDDVSLGPIGLEAAGGVALLVAATRFVRERSRPKAFERPVKRKVRLRRANVKKPPEVPVASLVAGDVIELGTGEDLPVDGRVVEGSGFVDEASILGPSLPAAKKKGDVLFAGTHSTIPDLVVEVLAPADEAYVLRRRRSIDSVAAELARTPRTGLGAGAVVALLALLGAASVVLLGDRRSVEAALPVVAAILLASPAAAPTIALVRSRLAMLEVASLHGLVMARAKDLLALSRVKRWQIDPALLSAPGDLEAVALGDASSDGLIQVAEALYDGSDGPERQTLCAALDRKKLARLRGAALQRGGGVYRGTIDGKRYFMGAETAIEQEEKITIDPATAAPIEFLREKLGVAHLIGTAEDGLLGVIGIGIGSDPDVQACAASVGATMMPGLSDGTRRALAEAAGIPWDGPPPSKRDATILAIDSDPPSSGLRVRVMPFDPKVELEPNSSPRLFRASLGKLSRLADELRSVRRKGYAAAVLSAVVPPLVSTAMAHAGVASGALGTIVGLIAILAANGRAIPGRAHR
jgi:cation transport ATPase